MRFLALVFVVAASLAGCREPGPSSASPAAQPGTSSVPVGAGSAVGPIKEGEPAPALVATASNGTVVDLAKLRGRHVVVYFYPKDDTPGCTREACAFRDTWVRFEKANVTVIGVSVDDDASHKAFTEKHKLPFPLLADSNQAISKAFGVPVTSGYAARVTFLIGPDGVVKKVYPKVDPGVHAEQILADVGG